MQQIHLGVFETPSPGILGQSFWSHPEQTSTRYTDVHHWTEMAQRLEEARLDFLFLADAYGYPVIDGDTPDAAFASSLDVPRLDPAVLVSAVAAATRDLGIALTSSTSFVPAYGSARTFASLDHLTRGRVGWNVVTSSFSGGPALFGVDPVPHDQRYAAAEDYLQLSYRLFEGGWDDDAVVRDVGRRVYADPRRVHRLHHDGPHVRMDGYFGVEPSVQRTPVIFQAGSSPSGRAFAARHAECVFLQGTTVEGTAGFVRDIRARAAAEGRDPASVKTVVGLSTVIAPTREAARARHEELLGHFSREAAIASYSTFTGIDLGAFDPDTPMDALHTEGGQTQVQRHQTGAGGGAASSRTVGEVLAQFQRRGVRGFVAVGSPEDVADEALALVEATGVDGFLLEPYVTPGTVSDFCEHVVPILRARGAFRHEYEEHTLRERISGTTSPRLPADHPGAAFRPAARA